VREGGGFSKKRTPPPRAGPRVLIHILQPHRPRLPLLNRGAAAGRVDTRRGVGLTFRLLGARALSTGAFFFKAGRSRWTSGSKEPYRPALHTYTLIQVASLLSALINKNRSINA
jgi:hypothetical protein